MRLSIELYHMELHKHRITNIVVNRLRLNSNQITFNFRKLFS